MGYKSYDNYIIMRVTKAYVQKMLGYKSRSGLNKLMKKLNDRGFIIMKKGYLVAVYYSSNKIGHIVRDIKGRENEKNRNITPNTKPEMENTCINQIKQQNSRMSYNTMRGSP